MRTGNHSIIAACDRYLLEEPNEDYRQEIERLLRSDTPMSWLELRDRMRNLSFGTAGLRGKMEAGYNRMNLVTVFRLGYALGTELKLRNKQNLAVVIGFDAREHSRNFVNEVSMVLRYMAINVHIFPMQVPTPLCAYATRKLNADAGVMITASHNPAYDNGIKLFENTSAQAVRATVARIEEHMAQAPTRADFYGRDAELNERGIGDEFVVEEDLFVSYFNEIASTQFLPTQQLCRDISVVYTPLHGVGKYFFLRALANEGFTNITVVAEQSEPNGRFPTVVFPNPEEEHTLDLAHHLARQQPCDVVLANDPDADRLQVSCADAHGEFAKLSGNDIGVILGYFAILRAQSVGVKPLLASSIVSSRLMKTMCARMNAHYVDALTGFSNIVEAAIRKQDQGDHQLVFAYEEAIGFLVGSAVLDKDGIHAAVRFSEIVGYLKSQGKTIWQFLDELYIRFGVFVTSSWSLRFDGSNAMDLMRATMKKARAVTPVAMAKLLHQSECIKYDLHDEQANNAYDGLRADVVIFEIETCARLIIRPSGTEPKIKFYVELNEEITDHHMLSIKKKEFNERTTRIKSEIESLFREEAS